MHRIPPLSHLESVLGAAVRVDAAIGGCLQVMAPNRRTLTLLFRRGLSPEFEQHFAEVVEGDGSACSQAMAERRRVVIRDVDVDADFAPHRKLAAACGFRAVQSSPLVDSNNRLLGMLSTHFAQPHHPSTSSLKDLDRCCHVASLMLECLAHKEQIEDLDRKTGVPFRALSPEAAHAANAARTLLPLLGQDTGHVLLAKVETNMGIVAHELGALQKRLAVA